MPMSCSGRGQRGSCRLEHIETVAAIGLKVYQAAYRVREVCFLSKC